MSTGSKDGVKVTDRQTERWVDTVDRITLTAKCNMLEYVFYKRTRRIRMQKFRLRVLYYSVYLNVAVCSCCLTAFIALWCGMNVCIEYK